MSAPKQVQQTINTEAEHKQIVNSKQRIMDMNSNLLTRFTHVFFSPVVHMCLHKFLRRTLATWNSSNYTK